VVRGRLGRVVEGAQECSLGGIGEGWACFRFDRQCGWYSVGYGRGGSRVA
jgi:hypothetical protein